MTDFNASLTDRELVADTPAEPIPANGREPVACARCSTENPAGAQTCTCGAFLPANQAARKSGIYARQQPADLRLTAEELVAGIVADRGGELELSTLEKAYIRNLGDITIVMRLLLNDLVTRTLFTPGGNPRKSYDAYLAAIDRFDRLGQRVGLERRPRRIDLARQLSGLDGAR